MSSQLVSANSATWANSSASLVRALSSPAKQQAKKKKKNSGQRLVVACLVDAGSRKLCNRHRFRWPTDAIIPEIVVFGLFALRFDPTLLARVHRPTHTSALVERKKNAVDPPDNHAYYKKNIYMKSDSKGQKSSIASAQIGFSPRRVHYAQPHWHGDDLAQDFSDRPDSAGRTKGV